MSEKQLKLGQHFMSNQEFSEDKKRDKVGSFVMAANKSVFPLTWWKTSLKIRSWVLLVGFLYACNYKHVSVHQRIQLSIQKRTQ